MNATERLDSEVLAPLARRQAARLRTRAYNRMRADILLSPAYRRAEHQRLEAAEGRFTPGFFWPGVWTDEARRAYFGLS